MQMKAEIISIGLAVIASAMSLAEVVDVAPATRSVRRSGETRTVTLPGGAKMEMIWCEPGKFQMGSPSGESGRLSNEPLHSVTLTKGFWLGKYEVTQSQWESVMRSNHSRFRNGDSPVENVSWYDCEAFVKRVNPAFGGKARLPTEAEWEYACRAGSDAPFAGSGVVSEMAWYDENSEHHTHEVGANKPNAWGFYDMHGNIFEVCLDWCEDDISTYGGAVNIDHDAPAKTLSGKDGVYRVWRSGSYRHNAAACRSAYRTEGIANGRYNIAGLRLACPASAE